MNFQSDGEINMDSGCFADVESESVKNREEDETQKTPKEIRR